MLVQMIPSAPSRSFDWENSGLAVCAYGRTILNMNDNVADEQLCQDIINEIGKVDVYFVQSASVTTFPSCFKMTDDEKNRIVRSKVENYNYQDIVINEIKPEYLIPYAGDLGWFGEQEQFNYWSRSTPVELVNYIKSKGLKSCIFESEDKFVVTTDNIKTYNNSKNNWNDYDKVIKNNSEYYSDIVKKNESRVSQSFIPDFSSHLYNYIESIN